MVDLHAAILADPFDDAPRLVYADWLEESGESEQAEFIRTQIAHPNATAYNVADTAEFCPINFIPLISSAVIYRRGFPDEIRCTIAQWIGEPCKMCRGGRYVSVVSDQGNCRFCHGTGRTPGIAKAVCEKWPVTTVTLTDAPSDQYALAGWVLNDAARVLLNVYNVVFNTKTEALVTLSHAAVNYGRRLAGLPDLEDK